ncbi:LexA family protein [Microvirga arsenatis]
MIGHDVCASFPSPAQDYIEDNVELPRWMAPNPAFTFLFKVGGHSMVKARIFPATCSSSTAASRGRTATVVMDIGGERSVKRLLLNADLLTFL